MNVWVHSVKDTLYPLNDTIDLSHYCLNIMQHYVTTRPVGTNCPVGLRLTALQRADLNPSIMEHLP